MTVVGVSRAAMLSVTIQQCPSQPSCRVGGPGLSGGTRTAFAGLCWVKAGRPGEGAVEVRDYAALQRDLPLSQLTAALAATS